MTIHHEKAMTLWPPTCHGRWMGSEYVEGLVSVVIPTYNRGHRLVQTLDSVYAQTYRPIEILVVDDGSTDDTPDILAEWRAEHSADPSFCIAFFRQENRGAPAARNRGAIESHGEYIHFWDCEDIMHPKKLEKQVDVAKLHHADIVVCNVGCFRDAPGDMAKVWKYGSRTDVCQEPAAVMNAWVTGGGWGTLGVLIRRTTACAAGPWRESLSRYQDLEFISRAAICADAAAGVGEALSFARANAEPGCISSDISEPALDSMIEACTAIRDNLVKSGRMSRGTQLLLHCSFVGTMNRALKGGHREVALQACQAALELAPPDRPFRRVALRAYLPVIRLLNRRALVALSKTVNFLNAMANTVRIKRPATPSEA